jgi:hypothetical protein
MLKPDEFLIWKPDEFLTLKQRSEYGSRSFLVRASPDPENSASE